MKFSSACRIFYLLLISCSCLACTSDDGSMQTDDYLSASIDGADFLIDWDKGEFTSRKFVNSTGMLNLQISGRSHSGDAIEFEISNYQGAKSYDLGTNVISPGKITYKRLTPIGDWSANLSTNNFAYPARIDILIDDGAMVEGKFEFDGYNRSDHSRKSITNGKFRVRIP